MKPRIVNWTVAYSEDRPEAVDLILTGRSFLGLRLHSTARLTKEQARKIGGALTRYGSRP